MIRVLLGFILALALIGATYPEQHVARVHSAEQEIKRLRGELKAEHRRHGKTATKMTQFRRGLWKLRRIVGARVERGDVMLGFRCIQGYEGSWRDPNAPYWGGLQADMDFMETYAPTLLARLGTADNWPPIAQLSMGVIAYYSGRGFGPWPNTRRMCGL